MPTVFQDIKYKKVAANTVDDDSAIVPPNGDVIGIMKFRATGADPAAYVVLAYDFGGPGEKIFATTRGDIDYVYDPSVPVYQVTGDGIAKLSIVIINDNETETPIIGGSYEAINLGVE